MLVLSSDNGGPLPHSTNAPLRGGKHTLWDGGVRVVSFVTGPLIPQSRRGTKWSGLAHSSDWFVRAVPHRTSPPDFLSCAELNGGQAAPLTGPPWVQVLDVR